MMTGFLYFLPNVRPALGTGDLERFGLSHIRDSENDHIHSRECIANGPNGLRGLVIGRAGDWATEDVKQSELVEWVRFPKSHAAEQAWLGFRKDRPMPGPADLARSVQLPGELVTLADDQRWLVPIARDFSGVCRLPIAYDLDEETGQWQANKVRREYLAVWNHAMAYFSAVANAMEQLEAGAGGPQVIKFEVPDGHQLVSDALSVNYRVSARELATLGLLVTGIVQQVAEVLIDLQGAELLKKSEVQDSGNGLSGTVA